MPMERYLLITGVPGCGKTTLIRRLAAELVEYSPAGFFTEEIREAGARKGFRLMSLDGREGLLSHVRIKGRQRVGRYGVDVKGFEAFLEVLDLAGSEAPLVLLDEIGKMECLSPRFVSLVAQLLDGDKVVAATVALRGPGLISAVKARPDCRLVEVRPAERDRLPVELAGWLRGRLGQPSVINCSPE